MISIQYNMKKSSKQSLGITILKWKMTKITRYIELVEPAPRHKWDEQSQRVRVKMNKYCRANNYTPFLSIALSLSLTLYSTLKHLITCKVIQ